MTIGDLTPNNLQTQLNKFEQDPEYNPQFTYDKPIDPNYLTSWGEPDPEIIAVADQLISVFTSEKLEPLETHSYHPTEIEAAVEAHVNHLPPEVGILPVSFNPDQIPRCRITKDGLIFRTDLVMTREDFEGLLRHEIDTHFLRHFNQEKNNLTRFELPDQGRTEEGLATLNNYLFHPRPFLVKSALRYKAAVLGKTMSFSQLYQALLKLDIAPREALRATLRVKRGLGDTSQPGVTTKDIIYLEGTVKVLRWLKTKQQPLSNVYVGQISLERLAQLGDVSTFSQITPAYCVDETKYLERVTYIIEYNGLSNLL